MSSSSFILGTFIDQPQIDGSTKRLFSIMSVHLDKDAAKSAVESMATSIMQGAYANGISLFELKHDDVLYTFQKEDVKVAYARIQKQQLDSLKQQKTSLQSQQEQLDKQMQDLRARAKEEKLMLEDDHNDEENEEK